MARNEMAYCDFSGGEDKERDRGEINKKIKTPYSSPPNNDIQLHRIPPPFDSR